MTIERVELGVKDTSAGCACCAAPTQQDAPAETASASEDVVLVEGMTCGHCVSSVTEELTAVEGVEGVEVDLVAGGVSTVTIRRSGPLARDAVEEAVREAGYSVAR
ncbi:cation transporter [Microbacterium betulae]|uniref:Cation transporter n=1 Tax=Microbacterium betulae TaxID=2981139 RepID=A0AA97I645_9MICO|nr:cation transporter [Microbacterium sp. AB]WOF23429.1 cation transporter [Microbacterium sp. AB]